MAEKVLKKTVELADRVGQFIEYWGFKEVHGRIWTMIFLSPEPVDANFLIDQLQVSKALVSMSIKDLLYYNVIFEVAKDKPGTQKYAINPDITTVILDVIRKRELVMLQEIQKKFTELNDVVKSKKEDVVSRDRLKDLDFMIDSAHLLLKGMVAGQNVDFGIFAEATKIPEESNH